MIAILGAGGAVGNQLVKELAGKAHRIRLAGRNPTLVPGAAEAVAADLSDLDQTIHAVSGSAIAHLLVGLKYDLATWQTLWPRIMRNVIEACKRVGTKLVFFDNVYMYGRVNGPMTEDTPFNPCSRKGEIRAQIATTLLNEIKAGNLTAMIARCADFYGPEAHTSIANILVFDNLAKGAKASWPVNDSVRHSFTFTPDAAKSLVLLGENDRAWNQTWHVPTAPDPPTGKQFIEMAARELRVKPRYRILSRPVFKIVGLFDHNVRESYEMLYQNDSEYLFDSTKFTKTFQFEPASYTEGIRASSAAYKSVSG